MSIRTSLVAIGLLTLGCQPVATDDYCANKPGVVRAPVRDGSVTHGFLAVGRLLTSGGSCSGTLIGPNKVLTAMHCIDDAEPSEVSFILEDEAGERSHFVRAIDFTESAMWGDVRATRVEDIALVHLARNIDDVAPMLVSSSPVVVGETLSIVGYGETALDRGDSGTKRYGEYAVLELRESTFRTGGEQGSCPGDSGGPVLRRTDTGWEQVGITHAGGCQSDSIVNRVDIFSDFIDNEVAPIEDPTAERLDAIIVVERDDGERIGGVHVTIEGGGLEAPVEAVTSGDGDVRVMLIEGAYEMSATHDALGLEGTMTCNVLPPVGVCRLVVRAVVVEEPTPVCSDTCRWAGDGECDDGGPGHDYSVCAFGTDCADCGGRDPRDEDRPFDTAGPTCNDSCPSANDGECDDGSKGSLCAICGLGTDCSDCGGR